MARPRLAWAALLALLAAAAAAGAAAQPCRLPLYLNATASTISLEGSTVEKPFAFPLTPAFPNAQSGFEGGLTLALPGDGPCPTTANGVLAALAGATLQPSAAAGPLLLYPAQGIEVRGRRGVRTKRLLLAPGCRRRGSATTSLCRTVAAARSSRRRSCR